MKMTLHIFVKDVRHLWREIAVSLALVVAYGWSVPREWMNPDRALATGAVGLAFFVNRAEFWAGLLPFLLPSAWLLAVIRAIQADSLVGDRQFWVTRPYEWRHLLAAKFLFIVALVNLPMLILDLYLLWRAGFAPGHHLAGLLRMQLLMSFGLFLPAAVLATITATVAQFLLAVLLILVCKVGTDLLSQEIGFSHLTSTGMVPDILVMATFLAITGLQFARRRTLLSRWLLLGLMAALALVARFTPYRTLFLRQHPRLAAGLAAPFQFAIRGNLGTWTQEGKTGSGKVGILLPLTIERADPDSILIIQGSQVELESNAGRKWEDDWNFMNYLTLMPADHNISVNFTVPRDLYQQLGDNEVKLRLTLAFTYYQDTNRRTFVVPSGSFRLPDRGRCTATAPAGLQAFASNPTCLAPLHPPESLLVRLKLVESTCRLPEDAPSISDRSLGYQWIRGGPDVEFGISPVSEFSLAPFTFSDGSTRPDISRLALHGVCPGTPLTLSKPHNRSTMLISLTTEASLASTQPQSPGIPRDHEGDD
jgi:hypothetical protein